VHNDADRAYGLILEQLSMGKIDFENEVHPVGLLLYMLGNAVDEFCKENYRLS
jgi:hypothetical protein